jgi:HlyD family secretion protein
MEPFRAGARSIWCGGRALGSEGQVAARKRSRFWLWGSLSALVALVVLVGAVVAHSSGTKIESSRIGTVTRMDIAKSVVATGKVQPITKVEVKSKASGIVEKWYVDANAHVHKGQVLAQLDQQEILAQVAAQKATLLAAQANVKTAEANITQDEVTVRAPDLPMYESALRRNQEMKDAGVVSQQVLENANRDYLSMLNKQRTAVAAVSVDRAKLQQAQAQVAQSEASLNDHRVADRRGRAVAGSRDRRCGELNPGPRIDGHAGLHPGRHHAGICGRQGG